MSSQKLEALAKAQEIRIRMAELKREIKAMPFAEGRSTVADLLRTNDESVGPMYPRQLLLSVQRVGESRVAAWMSRAGVPNSKRVRQLTDNQRVALAEQVDPNVKREDVTARGFWRNAA